MNPCLARSRRLRPFSGLLGGRTLPAILPSPTGGAREAGMRFGCSKSSPGSGRTPVPTIPSQEFSTPIRYVEDEVVVEARGDLDAWSGPALQETVRQLLDEGTRRLAIDLAEAPFVDSTGLGALVWAYHRCEESGCVLRIEIGRA